MMLIQSLGMDTSVPFFARSTTLWTESTSVCVCPDSRYLWLIVMTDVFDRLDKVMQHSCHVHVFVLTQERILEYIITSATVDGSDLR